VTSAAYGYTVQKPLALGYLPLDLAREGLKVGIRGRDGNLHPAQVGPRSPYDPQGIRLRG
jgi:glycine cleavage system aminomethyltransferase T